MKNAGQYLGLESTNRQNQPKLLEQVRGELRARHYSLRTERSYVRWIVKYIKFHNLQHPSKLGESEISQYLTHLAVRDNVSASTQNQALCAIIFLYKHILKFDIGELDITWAKKPKRLPVVFTREEAKSVLNNLDGMNRVMAMLLYGSGLRLSECLQMRVKDIDFGYKQIIVRSGKGDKDRKTLLPEKLVDPLKKLLYAQ